MPVLKFPNANSSTLKKQKAKSTGAMIQSYFYGKKIRTYIIQYDRIFYTLIEGTENPQHFIRNSLFF